MEEGEGRREREREEGGEGSIVLINSCLLVM